jgi:serine/threonine-protein kinase
MTDDPAIRDNGDEGDPVLSADEERLVALASRIDLGQPIDWDAEERAARDDRERAVIAEMRLLADVARVGREHGPTLGVAGVSAAQETGEISGLGSTLDQAQASASTAAAAVPLAQPVPATWGALTIQSAIGRGAFSTVYRAQDNLGRLVALKLFPLQGERGIDWTARLLYEGRLLARLRHENVVTVFGADHGDGYVGLWMELVKGRTLEDELHTRVRFSADEAAQVGRVLCRALAAVHHAGLLHRDIKAHNVMRDETGRIVLMDFGSGREAHPAETAGPAADLAGTPLYLAPELFSGQSASVASDIYSLGVLLFHLVSDQYPVQGTNRREIQRAHADRRRLWLRDLRPDLPEAFVRVVERALTADRTQRYQSAGELEDALAGISLQSSSSTASSSSGGSIAIADPAQDTPQKRRTPFLQRWQLLAGGAATVMAILAIIVMASMRQSSGAAETSQSAISPIPSPSPSHPPQQSSDSAYAVQATFYKQDGKRETTLTGGERVEPGDTLGVRLSLSKPAYVYIANQDEEGEGFLLYPRAEGRGPLEADREHLLPKDETGWLWQVTSQGTREHFLIFVSRTVLKEFDQLLRELPRAEAGRPVTTGVPRLPRGLITRSVGGLAPARKTPSTQLQRLFEQASPLSSRRETVEGAWIRELTLNNPANSPESPSPAR